VFKLKLFAPESPDHQDLTLQRKPNQRVQLIIYKEDRGVFGGVLEVKCSVWVWLQKSVC